ncbi:putative heme-binding domain-containing protein [Anseongella ginsenosidimutans]|uniref:Putative heme-binding domain-containing protein n=1 Tax=Anseongella ginsenosidimutans TaxID=496056 RepID=A0A4V2UTD9_9SPHI|nr:c-type cytochrome [Anseongella ginsenosidimutans]QEC52779.1 c-type cytochrome [Anseongella ginsenosidimutans]TCS85539.1 putative heme-binding domain-containing protein [Anseongella ginsenosidimutans]
MRLLFLAICCLPCWGYGQQLSGRTGALSPEEELAGFKLPEGFVIELVASERDGVVKPIDLAFDDAGRLWTQTARMYPLDPVTDIQWEQLLELMNDREKQESHPAFRRVLDLYQGKTKGDDKILVISGLYGEEKREVAVWADGLANPMSILPYKNGAYVAQGSELFFLDDTNQDGLADKRLPLLTGFGFTDSHTMTHLLTRGPGGWIYFSHGALNKGEVSSLTGNARQNVDYSKIGRFSLDAARLELVTAGLNNIWGLQLRGKGQWYGSEANDLGYSVAPMDPGTSFPGIGNERLRPYQPFMPALHEFRVGGTGLSGLAFAEDASGSFPAEWKDVAFLANPITSTINAVRIVRHADGSVSAEHLPDLLTSKDDWFRPVNLKFGPDGCLYIADWYNKIISHNEVPTSHPERDKTHGRIWRIRHVSQAPRPIPNLYEAKARQLITSLQSPSLWEKRAAWHQLAEREVKPATVGSLQDLLADNSRDEITRIHALWSLEALNGYDAALWRSLLEPGTAADRQGEDPDRKGGTPDLKSEVTDRQEGTSVQQRRTPDQQGGTPERSGKAPDPREGAADDLRREAIRSLASFQLSPAEIAELLKGPAEDPNPMIRSQVLRTIAEIDSANEDLLAILVRACRPELPGKGLGGPYERRFERYLARKALEQYPEALEAFLKNVPAGIPVENILWAVQSLPQKQKEAAFLEFWPQAQLRTIDESTFVSIAGMLGNQAIYDAVRPLMEAPGNAADIVRFAIANQSQVQSPEMASLLQQPVSNLLQENDPEGIKLALDAANRFKIDLPAETVAALFAGQPSEQTTELIINALEARPGANEAVFSRIVKDDQFSFALRSTALHHLAKANQQSAFSVLKSWLPGLDTTQAGKLAETLSGSPQGAALLVSVYEKKLLPARAFSLSTAERIREAQPESSGATRLLAYVKEQQSARRQQVHSKMERFLAIATNNKGNPVKGAALFQTCLMCHQVGSQGVNLGPALDGSANRDSEALLTAILSPDAAVESGYAAYRITKKDGTSYQGLLVEKNDRGATIAFMGGSTVFIQAAEIKSQGFLPGRSFMPKGLIESYSDEQVADLLAYIRSLK